MTKSVNFFSLEVVNVFQSCAVISVIKVRAASVDKQVSPIIRIIKNTNA